MLHSVPSVQQTTDVSDQAQTKTATAETTGTLQFYDSASFSQTTSGTWSYVSGEPTTSLTIGSDMIAVIRRRVVHSF